jgi:hypothetical protein
MRLFFTCVSALLAATAGALWWVQGPQAAAGLAPAAPPAIEERPAEELTESPVVAHSEVAPATAAVEEFDSREAPERIEPSFTAVEDAVELADPGDFVLDTGPDAELETQPPVAPRSGGGGSIVHVDPERSGGWVERLLALYEVVRE